MAFTNVKFCKVDELFARILLNIPVPFDVIFPPFATVKKRFVVLAVVEKRFVVVALVVVEFETIRFVIFPLVP